ncbi:23S rRNA (guanosine(2251)-2'-O)-methyltransferase RlmB [Fervidibacillus halotolerans]|uniref:23S rRNA (Guanosine(2251)-2'-O)-methyltransferase RlmB n=1 Tax=Fervidibacillus halotolerans TaxID=2980027 RepID=A0A9E8RY12_9BACI|nr:23S rRNA (guanosine(2251)-2'-O)-methyltransferase RlmB [Fervidibacillus halotolerans]WAA12376.1 23S rRNA (guanosine(2251)-2'-O)-methyltransferase RlmB [Fervidibacillus halotolerans]
MENGYVIGRNAVLETLNSNRDINKIWIAEGSQKGNMQEVIKRAKERNVVIQYVPKKKLLEMVGENHQGVVAQVAAYQYAQLDELFLRADRQKEDPFFIILDEIVDPHNLGSIIRTADASGVHGIIIPKRRSVGLTATVAKASTGAIEYVPIVRVTNIRQTMDELKKRGVWIVGTEADAEQDYREMDGKMPLALVIGSEGKGIGKLVKENCDFLIRLPMKGHVTSLNASVAAAILMYEVYRKRYPVGT